jgi:tetratricopeptide (TPR) repeat protein
MSDQPRRTTDAPGATSVSVHSGVAAGRDIRDSTITINERSDEETLRRLLQEQFAAFTAQVAREKGVDVAPLRTILDRLGEIGVPDTEIPARLSKAADQLIELRAQLSRLSNERPELAVIRAQALDLIDRGDLDGARAALNRGREVARALRQEASRSEAELLADEARIDHLQLAYREAATKYAEAADLVRPFDREAEWLFVIKQAYELYHHGYEFGSNLALEEAVALYWHSLTLASQAESPLNWAMTQNDLGNILQRLGERAGDPERLEQAVAAYRAALEERTRERVPLDWATTQNDLGNALQILGERAGDPERLEQAIAAYRAALEEPALQAAPYFQDLVRQNLDEAVVALKQRR